LLTEGVKAGDSTYHGVYKLGEGGVVAGKMHNILAAASQPQPHLLSPLIPPLNEEKTTSGTAEQEMENIGNRIGNGIVSGFLHFPAWEEYGTLRD